MKGIGLTTAPIDPPVIWAPTFGLANPAGPTRKPGLLCGFSSTQLLLGSTEDRSVVLDQSDELGVKDFAWGLWLDREGNLYLDRCDQGAAAPTTPDCYIRVIERRSKPGAIVAHNVKIPKYPSDVGGGNFLNVNSSATSGQFDADGNLWILFGASIAKFGPGFKNQAEAATLKHFTANIAADVNHTPFYSCTDFLLTAEGGMWVVSDGPATAVANRGNCLTYFSPETLAAAPNAQTWAEAQADPVTPDRWLYEGGIHRPACVILDPDGVSLWVVNTSTRTVIKLDPNQGSSTPGAPVITTTLTLPAGNFPQGGAFDSERRLWLCVDTTSPAPTQIHRYNHPELGGSQTPSATLTGGTKFSFVSPLQLRIVGDASRVGPYPEPEAPTFDPLEDETCEVWIDVSDSDTITLAGDDFVSITNKATGHEWGDVYEIVDSTVPNYIDGDGINGHPALEGVFSPGPSIVASDEDALTLEPESPFFMLLVANGLSVENEQMVGTETALSIGFVVLGTDEDEGEVTLSTDNSGGGGLAITALAPAPGSGTVVIAVRVTETTIYTYVNGAIADEDGIARTQVADVDGPFWTMFSRVANSMDGYVLQRGFAGRIGEFIFCSREFTHEEAVTASASRVAKWAAV